MIVDDLKLIAAQIKDVEWIPHQVNLKGAQETESLSFGVIFKPLDLIQCGLTLALTKNTRLQLSIFSELHKLFRKLNHDSKYKVPIGDEPVLYATIDQNSTSLESDPTNNAQEIELVVNELLALASLTACTLYPNQMKQVNDLITQYKMVDAVKQYASVSTRRNKFPNIHMLSRVSL